MPSHINFYPRISFQLKPDPVEDIEIFAADYSPGSLWTTKTLPPLYLGGKHL